MITKNPMQLKAFIKKKAADFLHEDDDLDDDFDDDEFGQEGFYLFWP